MRPRLKLKKKENRKSWVSFLNLTYTFNDLCKGNVYY